MKTGIKGDWAVCSHKSCEVFFPSHSHDKYELLGFRVRSLKLTSENSTFDGTFFRFDTISNMSFEFVEYLGLKEFPEKNQDVYIKDSLGLNIEFKVKKFTKAYTSQYNCNHE